MKTAEAFTVLLVAPPAALHAANSALHLHATVPLTHSYCETCQNITVLSNNTAGNSGDRAAPRSYPTNFNIVDKMAKG
jgi:hypothetical protein